MLRIVFQNLLLNSAHAMHGKGRIRVAVDRADESCQIAFVDSGPGIPSETRDKMFTPFFTTKSRGTGLGLPTAKRLIEAHQGSSPSSVRPQVEQRSSSVSRVPTR
jgi:two-component system sensor histidine kinase AtoS